MPRKKLWIVIRNDGRVLTKKNRWSMMCDPRKFKYYKSSAWAIKALNRFAPLEDDGPHFKTRGHVKALYEGDTVDACGRIQTFY